MLATFLWLKFDSISDVIRTIIIAILWIMAIPIFRYWYQWKLSKRQMQDLDLRDDSPIQINFFSETFDDDDQTGYDWPSRATLYLREEFIFIRPRLGHWYKGNFGAPLPIVFTKNLETIKKLTNIKNIYIPDAIQQGSEGSVEIIFKYSSGSSEQTHFYIDFIRKEDLEKFRSHFSPLIA